MRRPQCVRPGCGEQKRETSKWCSNKCRAKHFNSLRPRKPKVIKACVVCGTKFAGRVDKKCCSSTCRSRLQAARERAALAETA